MTKVTLDRDAFKVLASDTRLEILRSLDGKNMTVTELSTETKMNKATLHEHLNKLQSVGLIKRIEREGHKWVYYKLSWKGSSLLHPDNNRIVVMFSITFLMLVTAITGFYNYMKSLITQEVQDGTSYLLTSPENQMDEAIKLGGERSSDLMVSNPIFLYIAVMCIIIFLILFVISYRYYKLNKKPRL